MKNSPAGFISGGSTFGTVIGDADPFGDMCSGATRGQVQMDHKSKHRRSSERHQKGRLKSKALWRQGPFQIRHKVVRMFQTN